MRYQPGRPQPAQASLALAQALVPELVLVLELAPLQSCPPSFPLGALVGE